MIRDVRFGSMLHEIRLKNRETLRAYCLKRGFDSGNISKLERNLISPPNTKRQLDKYLTGMKYSEFDYELLMTASVNFHSAQLLKRFT